MGIGIMRRLERHRHRASAAMIGLAMLVAPHAARASDHLDTPSVIADPRADIGDLYAWTSPDGRRLNLVMTIVGHSFSDRLRYVFHIDSGRRFGRTSATATITCRFPSAATTDCQVDKRAAVHGDAGRDDGLRDPTGRFRVFAGQRDDPFFNNVKGTRAAYQVAAAAFKAGAPVDAAGCPAFDTATVRGIGDQWRHTDGGPATNFLAGWSPAAIVVSIDLALVNKGGAMLGVWGTVSSPARQIDRAGRPLTGNALLGTIATEAVSDALKEDYNAATPATAARFVPEIEKALGLYDGFDGVCGNQLLADRKAPAPRRYRALATMLADDRLWVNTRSATCTQLFAVERTALADEAALAGDCGGRTPLFSAVNAYRSLLANGTPTGISDGVDRDERAPSDSAFPFLVRALPPAASPWISGGK
jgi:hypothetical protein